jgi:hypothetical protein
VKSTISKGEKTCLGQNERNITSNTEIIVKTTISSTFEHNILINKDLVNQILISQIRYRCLIFIHILEIILGNIDLFELPK